MTGGRGAETDRQTGRQADRQTDGQTDRQTDRKRGSVIKSLQIIITRNCLAHLTADKLDHLSPFALFLCQTCCV